MNSSRRGFTIIETMLVLAITGLVASVVLVSIGSALRNEQYHSAVDQIYDYFQGQYSLSSAILNDRASDDECTSGGLTQAGNGLGRGTSSCYIVGKVIKSTDGTTIESYQAIALDDVADATKFPGEANKNPKTVLEDAHITQGRTVTTYDVRGESGVKLTKPNGTAGAFTLLIARSPITGRIHTFVSDARQETPQVSTMTEVDLKLCVNPDGLINVGIQQSGILVTKSAANSSAVKLLGSGQCV